MTTLNAVQADITTLKADAIVNAANSSVAAEWTAPSTALLAPQLLEEFRGLGGCETGDAKITGACDLPVEFGLNSERRRRGRY